jgi:hypothetical protein
MVLQNYPLLDMLVPITTHATNRTHSHLRHGGRDTACPKKKTKKLEFNPQRQLIRDERHRIFRAHPCDLLQRGARTPPHRPISIQAHRHMVPRSNKAADGPPAVGEGPSQLATTSRASRHPRPLAASISAITFPRSIYRTATTGQPISSLSSPAVRLLLWNSI